MKKKICTVIFAGVLIAGFNFLQFERYKNWLKLMEVKFKEELKEVLKHENES